MKQIIIACNTLRDEVETVLRQEKLDIGVVWFPSGLHNVPAELNQRIQEELDKLPQCDHVLLAMAYCGNSIAGVKTRDFTLTVPRVDDCISLLLGRVKTRVEDYKGVYFMTAGWLRGERNMMTEYRYTLEKYGPRRGERIFQALFRNYTDMAMLDSGCFDKAAVEEEMRRSAETLKLGYREIPGDLTMLRQLLTGPWPEDKYLTVEPNSTITVDMLELVEDTAG